MQRRQSHDLTREELLIERAWVLQGLIKAQRDNLKHQEQEYKEIVAEIQKTGQARHGQYSIATKTTQRRSIISSKFFKAWPEVFVKIARVNIKDAEAELGKDKLDTDIFEVKDHVSTSVIKHELPQRKEMMV
jgi:ATP-dependent DNA helicase RecQ